MSLKEVAVKMLLKNDTFSFYFSKYFGNIAFSAFQVTVEERGAEKLAYPSPWDSKR